MKTINKKITATLLAVATIFCTFFALMLFSSPQTAKADTTLHSLVDNDNLKGKYLIISSESTGGFRFYRQGETSYSLEMYLGYNGNEENDVELWVPLGTELDSGSAKLENLKGVNRTFIDIDNEEVEVVYFDDIFSGTISSTAEEVEFSAETILVYSDASHIKYLVELPEPPAPPKTLEDFTLPDSLAGYTITELNEGDAIVGNYVLVLNPCNFGFSLGDTYAGYNVEEGFYIPLPGEYDWKYFEFYASEDWWTLTYISEYETSVLYDEDSDGVDDEINISIKKGDILSDLCFYTEDEQAPEGFALYLVSAPTSSEEFQLLTVDKEMPDVSGLVEIEVGKNTNVIGRVVRVPRTYEGDNRIFCSAESMDGQSLVVNFISGTITFGNYIIEIPWSKTDDYYDMYIPMSSDIVIDRNGEQVNNPITLESFTVSTVFNPTVKVYLLGEESEIPPKSDIPDDGQEPEENKPSVIVRNENANGVFKVLISVVLISFLGFGCFYIIGKFKSKNKRRK